MEPDDPNAAGGEPRRGPADGRPGEPQAGAPRQRASPGGFAGEWVFDEGAGGPEVGSSNAAAGAPRAGTDAGSASDAGARARARATGSRSGAEGLPSLESGIRALLVSILGAGPADPVHRVGLALVAWPPIGIAIADVIGRLTGCATYAVSCDGSDPLLPWLGQA
ncbi:MAG TPA: hypothetical protein VFW86_06315, partial [Candidatus Limnocylindrales bacterium]|nr:hypothetical protein [Candidatus Limnocylindrales bacterium]